MTHYNIITYHRKFLAKLMFGAQNTKLELVLTPFRLDHARASSPIALPMSVQSDLFPVAPMPTNDGKEVGHFVGFGPPSKPVDRRTMFAAQRGVEQSTAWHAVFELGCV